MADPIAAAISLNASIERDRSYIPIEIIDDYEHAALNGRDLQTVDAHRGDTRFFGPAVEVSALDGAAYVSTLSKYLSFLPHRPRGTKSRQRLLAELSSPHPSHVDRGGTNILPCRRSTMWMADANELDLELVSVALPHARTGSATPCPADAARNALGLLHYQPPVQLILLRGPASRFPALHNPTFVNGADNRAFCLWPGSNHTGYTWHLMHQCRGLAEVVAPPPRLQDFDTVQYLGEVSTRVAIDYVRFLARRP